MDIYSSYYNFMAWVFILIGIVNNEESQKINKLLLLLHSKFNSLTSNVKLHVL